MTPTLFGLTGPEFDAVTFVLWLGIWPLFLAWEIATLVARKKSLRLTTGELVGTISMVARKYGWRLSSLVFVWCGMATHWWWNGDSWAGVPGTITFWSLVGVLLIIDVARWRSVDESPATWPKWEQRVWNPKVWVVTGLLAGALLFPQKALAAPACWANGHNQHRSEQAKSTFRHAHPCPGGVDKGSTRRCRGYVIDHVCPLACCGADAPSNMQWQTEAAGKVKDRWELDCARSCKPMTRRR